MHEHGKSDKPVVPNTPANNEEAGLRQLWRECVLARFLRGEIDRTEATEAVGVDWVELAERQNQAMLEDLAWAMGQGWSRSRMPSHSSI